MEPTIGTPRKSTSYICGSCGETCLTHNGSCPHCESHQIYPISSSKGHMIYDEENQSFQERR